MNSWWQQVFARLQNEPGTPLPGGGWRVLATVLAWGYGLGARGRRWLYDTGWLKVQRLTCGVISIGNLTVGGTGKTPLVIYLAQRLQDQGRRVAILSRGYGSTAQGTQVISDGEKIFCQPPQAGDESYLLARQLHGIPVLTGASRYAAGLVAEDRFHPELVLLDDGFQHFQLHRDLDLVLLDAAHPFGNGRLLPRGPLREPLSTLQRSVVLVLTRYREEQHREQYTKLQAAFPDTPILRAGLRPRRVLSHPAGQLLPAQSLRGQRLLAFAGLARPWVFAASLQELGVDITEFHPFPDHYPYDIKDLERLAERSRQLGVQALVTTEKDWARLGERWELEPTLLVLGLEVEWLDHYSTRIGDYSLEF
ncbi:MAG: tetraacyldisaccharide 4'-kinase [Deltaproteobacteria bacterium]|nr:tetraacyldisaccharide 4'-kinase [Deltaproteobacteria bacterium]MBW1953104.1 tetraacyldisaccharide 4'-kinase [Deltaproteobacteria bacterium]MBW1987327.1 tetraacyldisaccharide 4'-kinase [Deltaproteobacteria bacterium]MBW2135062.1 tetraacyldisaccharide 4'-kinase [Deltaproteobacteria bacterium]